MTILVGNPFVEMYYAVKKDIEEYILDPNASRFKTGGEFIIPAIMPTTDQDHEYPLIIIKLINTNPSPLGAGDFIQEEYSTNKRKLEGFKYDITVWVGLYTKKDIMYNVDWENDGNVTEIGYLALNEYFLHEIVKATSSIDNNISNSSFSFLPKDKTITMGYNIDESRILTEISFPVTIASADYHYYNESDFINTITNNVDPTN